MVKKSGESVLVALIQLAVTYFLRDNFHVFFVFNQFEGGARPGAVSVCWRGVCLALHHAGLAEGAEVQRIDNATLVGLTSDQFAHGVPNFGDLFHLVALLVVLPLLPCQLSHRGAGPRARYRCHELCVQLPTQLRQGTFAHESLENVLFIQSFRRHWQEKEIGELLFIFPFLV